MTRLDYLRDPAEIYAKSFATIAAEVNFANLPQSLHPIATRLIHACGMTDLAHDLRGDEALPEKIRHAVQQGKPIITDCEMAKSGIIRRLLPSTAEILCPLNDPQTTLLAAKHQTTRSAAAVELWKPHMAGAVIVIGNAPTALFALLEALDQGAEKPAAIIGLPVGFVGAIESKQELAANPRGVAYLTLHGRRGGSAMAAAALNAVFAGNQSGAAR